MDNPETDYECPAWCIANHDEQTSPDDAWHESQEVLVPAIELVSRATEDGFRFNVEGVDLEVGLERRVDGRETFVRLGVGEQRERNFRLSVESSERLVEVINHVLQLGRLSSNPIKS